MMMSASMLLKVTTFLIMSVANAQIQPLALGSLVWSEEFNDSDGGAVDESRWSHDLGNGNWGWGNGEVQSYTRENLRVEGGSAVISVTKNDNNQFESARIRTNGKVEFQYGSVEARIKLSSLNDGFWPAFWMLGSNFESVGWPACGELDIMEAGQADSIAQQSVNRVVSSAAHWQDSNGAYATYGTHLDTGVDFPDQWQTFRVDWTLDSVRTFVDGQHIWSLDISGEPTFHQPFYLLANMAVGGQFTSIMNANDITAPVPGTMEIDYIRIYNNELVDATITIGGIQGAPPNASPTSNPTSQTPTGSSLDNGPPTSSNNDNLATDYGVIDCGKPESCTADVLNTVAGDSTCLGHISWLMKVRGRDELYACDSVARKAFPEECGACNPGTGAPFIDYSFNCGDNSATPLCSNAVLNTDAPSPLGATCGERISHLIEVDGISEEEACATVAGVEFVEECGKCIRHVVSCGKSAGSECHAVLDSLVGDYTCRSRISWVVYAQNNTEEEACRHVATDSESASVCSPCLP
jgi:beta-glucanase (GH16 family)